MSLRDFLTDEEIAKCIGRKQPYITEMIVKPNLERINKALNQENDARFIGYAIEYAISQATKTP